VDGGGSLRKILPSGEGVEKDPTLKGSGVLMVLLPMRVGGLKSVFSVRS